MGEDPLSRRLRNYRRRLARAPDDGRLWLELADFLHTNYEAYRLELRAYREAAKHLPRLDLRLRIGRAQCQCGDARSGLATMRQFLRERPVSYGYCMLANELLQEDRFRDAEKAARRAVDLDPKFEEAYLLLGQALRKSSPGAATRMFKKAVALDPKYAHGWSTLGAHLVRRGSRKGALLKGIKALAGAIELNPEDGWAMLFMANALWRLGRYDEAEIQYRAAIKTFPDFPECRRWYREFLEYREYAESRKPGKTVRGTTTRSASSRSGSGGRSSRRS